MTDEILDAEVLSDESEIRGQAIPITITGLGPEREPKRVLPVNGFAVASFVTLLSTVLLWWTLVPAPLAVVFAQIALKQLKVNRQGGRSLALIGLLGGYALILAAITLLSILFVHATFSFLSGPHGVG